MIMKIFVGLLAMVLLIGGVSAAPVTSFENLLGDVDGSGIVDAEDIRLMMLARNNRLTASECAVWGVIVDEFPDVNNDGVFGYDDIASIEYLYSTTASGRSTGIDYGAVDTTHTYIVGDVDGDGVFDMDDLSELIDGRGSRYILWRISAFIRHGLITLDQITRSI